MKTKTKIGIAASLASVALLMGAAVIGYQDFQLRGSAPGNPASGYLRIWADNTAGKFKCLTSAGAACFFDSATSGSVSSIATTSPITGGTITSTGTIACATCAVTIASGAKALGTSAISSGACATVATDTATGALTTDVLTASFNGDPTAVTGYIPSTSGMLTILVYPTPDTANFKVCNVTSASITPGAITLNWRVTR